MIYQEMPIDRGCARAKAGCVSFEREGVVER